MDAPPRPLGLLALGCAMGDGSDTTWTTWVDDVVEQDLNVLSGNQEGQTINQLVL